MTTEEVVIEVESVSKRFLIYDRVSDRLRESFLHRFRSRAVERGKRYSREFWALRDVSFTIRRGETVGIIGRNGSGKSTLLQLVVGTLNQTEGRVATHGRISALLELGAGFNPEFTGRENVYLSASILGIPREEMQRRFADIEAFAGIGEFIDQPAKTYSSGMYVRLAFAVAIHVSPNILVVDEALAVGDTAFQTKCLTRIRDMQAQGVTIVLVTHSTNTVVEYCDRAIYLKKGRLVEDGTCRSVVRHYADDLVDEEGGMAMADQGIEDDEEQLVEEREPKETQPQTLTLEADDIDGHVDRKSLIRRISVIDPVDGVEKQTFNYGDQIRVRVSFEVFTQSRLPCFGIELKSVDDIVLWSATTRNMRVEVPPLEPGMHDIEWTLNADFSGNRYVFAIGIGDIDSGDYRRHSRAAYGGHFDILPQPGEGSGWLSPRPRFHLVSEVSKPKETPCQ